MVRKKWMTRLSLLALMVTFPHLACTSTKYAKSDHFDGQRFHNAQINVNKGIFDLLKWKWGGTATEWPEWRELDPVSVGPQPSPVQGQTTYINHATHLIQMSGASFLTDPIFSKRASPVSWAGPKRIHRPAIELSALPKIDYVVISHNHYDHLDSESIRMLAERFNPLFIVPLGNQDLVESFGAKRVTELDWWQTLSVEGTDHRVTLVPAQHWSARGIFDRNRALWGGYVVENTHLKVYFAGDTGYNDFFSDIKKRFGRMDLSILPIGAYEPRWFMREQHMNPEEAVQAHRDLESKFSLGTHFGTFPLTDEGWDVPPKDLEAALKKTGSPLTSFIAPKPGESHLIGSTVH